MNIAYVHAYVWKVFLQVTEGDTKHNTGFSINVASSFPTMLSLKLSDMMRMLCRRSHRHGYVAAIAQRVGADT